MNTAIVVGVLAVVYAGPAVSKEVTFDDRVQHQRAIEEVYWKHRVWPAENPSPKPALAEVLSDAALRAKVETYLKESAALETIWRRPITRDQLQAEIDRMVRDTRDGRMLAELFQALGDDPGVIAETLARQTLADRLIRDWYAHDTRFHGATRRRAEAARAAVDRPEDLAGAGGDYRKTTYPRDGAIVGRIGPVEETWDAFVVTAGVADSDEGVEVATVTWSKVPFDTWWAGQRSSLPVALEAPSGTYEVAVPLSADCIPDSWTPTYFGVPDGRTKHTAVWTGSEMIVWGGETISGPTETGGRYSPATDTWKPTPTGPGVPAPRSSHTAIYTGQYMVVWGGDAGPIGSTAPAQSGGRYDPSADVWLPVSTTGAPSARSRHTASWTGSLMVVWGGSPMVTSGGRYNPANDTWSAMSTGAGVPSAREDHTAVLAFPDVIVWGGRDGGGTALNTGARYSPATDTWATVTTTSAASARWGHAAIWTGSQMIVWGGRNNAGALNTGGRYQRSTDSWTATSLGSGLPTPRYDHAYVWTLGKLIVWGGVGPALTNSGAAYDPPSDTWTQTSVGANVPAARAGAKAVWTNTEMIVWGGSAATALATGGRYNPTSNTWVATSTGSYVPSARSYHTGVWTGTELIVWGGLGPTYLISGGRYNAATDVWTPTTATSAPSGRQLHTAVWTGTRMIVWGGYTGAADNTGARYDPAADTWTATAIAGPASARYFHTAVWTGSVMVVWGGQDNTATPLDTGARYDPSTDSWAPTSFSNAPSPRLGHTAVWTGTEMIVWGGGDYGGGINGVNTGGRYNPAANAWTQTSIAAGVPSARFYHVAAWTGSEMIVWGGAGVVTGGRYTPGTNSWVATPTGGGVPPPRALANAVWTGAEMIVWGGIDAADAPLASGGRFSPAAATWTATSNGSHLPTPRFRQAMVWTGSAMLVWGGEPWTSTGARYCATTCASPNMYWLDADLDGYGASGTSLLACSQPTGYSPLSTDCDDGNPNVNPGALDPCDGTDRNCDGFGDTVIPGEVNFTSVARLGPFDARFTWSTFPGARSDVYRGVFAGAIGTDPFFEFCLGNNTTQTTWDDTNPPDLGTFWWLLVRATNGCGNGTLGFRTVHATPTIERISLVCP